MVRSMAVSLAGLLALAGGSVFSGPAAAAESYDNCNNFIDSIPATISTQGVWCLRKDVATAMTSGNAIRINTNNVTIDCNGFKIGGLAGGPDSSAVGIFADQRQNVTVRGCGIRGFRTGISIKGGAGHLVERNRLDHNLEAGIALGAFTFGGPSSSDTENSVVRHNMIFDTGRPAGTAAVGIMAMDADVLDNTISGLFTKGEGTTYGIIAPSDALVRGNRVREIEATDSVTAWGILASANTRIEGNILHMAGPGDNHMGIWASSAFCMNNTITGFPTPMTSCDGSGNATR